MALGLPTVVGIDVGPYDAWVWTHLGRVVALRTEPGLAVCWGAAPPPDARAVVHVPKDPQFLSQPEVLRCFASTEPATTSPAVRPGSPPEVRLDVDVFSWFGWFISRAEEYEPFEADALGRFPRAAALAQQLGIMEVPVADRLALRLRAAIEAVAKAAGLTTAPYLPWPHGKRFAVCLTHDVDHATRRSVWRGGQLVAAAAASLVRGRWSRARRRLNWGLGLVRGGHHSPGWLFETFAEAERQHGFRSAFYLLPYESDVVVEAGRTERRYRIRRPEVLETFRRLAAERWELGLHTSYHAHDTADGLRDDWDRLCEVLGPGIQPVGSRSHALRFRVPETWIQGAACGIQYDATLGWPEGFGFRSGTLWPYQPFDRRASRALPLWELGLHAMDTHFPTLDGLVQKVRQVCDQAAEVGGCVCLLVHPTPPRHAEATVKDFLRAYAAILDGLASRSDAWVATPREVISRMIAAPQG